LAQEAIKQAAQEIASVNQVYNTSSANGMIWGITD
jgi:hypothetical protein